MSASRSHLGLSIAIAALSVAPPAIAQGSDDLREARFKAAVVYNFARFANWPPSRFEDAAAPLVLCVDPAEPLLAALNELDGRPVGSRRLRVKAARTFGQECHVAYVSSFEAGPDHIAALRRRGMLTVGESEDFARSGAIGLVKVGRQVRFEINTAAAKEAGVTLSSQLMRLAVLVR